MLKNRFKNIILFTALIFASSFFELESIERTPYHPNPMSEEALARMLYERDTSYPLEDVERRGGFYNFHMPLIRKSPDIHTLSHVSPSGRYIEIEDRSGWEIHESFLSIVKTWDMYDDTIMILPNTNWLWYNSCYYKIYNVSKNSTVYANISAGPELEKAHQIIHIDKLRGYLQLENGTWWSVSYSDMQEFQKWHVGHYIIIGTNNQWLSFKPYMLINCEVGFIRAKQM